MKRILWTLALWASLAWACGEPAPSGGQVGGECATHADCGQDEVCTDGQCQNLLCETDQECPFGYECSQGVCAVVEGFCNRNGDCRSGELCDRDTQRCVPAGQVERPCTSPRDCLAGEQCEAGLCAPAEAPNNSGAECQQDRDCPQDQRCERGACVPSDEEPDASEDPAQDPSEDTAQDTAQDLPEDATQDTPQDTTDEPDLPDPTLCVADLDCPPDQACDGGFCAQWACTRDAECPYSYQCSLGLCQRVPDFCTTDPECLPARLCDPARQRCADVEQLPGRCLTPAQCLPDELCTDDGHCEPPPPDPEPDLADPEPDVADPEPDLPDLDAPEDVIEDTPDDVAEDAPTDTTEDTPPDMPDMPEDAPEDVLEDIAPDLPDVPEDVPEDVLDMTDEPDTTDEPDLVVIPDTPDADTGGDVVVMDDPDVAEDVPFTPPPTPAPGTYRYARLPIGGVKALRKVEFHPDGSYAVVLEERNRLHLVDWTSREARVLDFTPTQGAYVWEDLRFDPSGDFALLVGWHEITSGGNTTKAGLIVRLDDLAARTGGDATDTLEVYPSHGIADPIQALRYPRGGGLPVVLARRNERSPYWAILRDFDPQTGFAGDLAALTTTDAGCDDFDFVNNEFGDPGMLVVCGSNGADTHYYTEVGGVGEWRANPGNNNLGNTSSVAAYPTGDYALVLSWSGRSVYRFEGGALNGYSDAPRFSSRAIHSVKFQQEGQRALIVGGAYFGANEQIGIVVEYRHDLYRCPSPGSNCELTYAHITGFNAPPYNATSNTTLRDSAFRPGCDGGLVVSGFTDFQNNVGQIIEFQIEGARPCR